MITDQKTNFVYFSNLLPKYKGCTNFFKKLKEIINHSDIKCGFLSDTQDIWCRDYMPIQISKDCFVQFRYDPGYLKSKKDRSTITNAATICEAIGIKPMSSEIKIDGGNVVKSRTKVIMTERIFTENAGFTKERLIYELQKLLKAKQIIIIPEYPDDEFGHADGMVRFPDGGKDERTVLVNDYSKEPRFKKKLYEALKDNGLMVVPIPYNPYGNRNYLDASGIYINYLQVGNFVIYPVYGLKEDRPAQKIFADHFGSFAIPIKANEIARHGGVLNCVSWNIKR